MEVVDDDRAKRGLAVNMGEARARAKVVVVVRVRVVQ